MSPRHTHILQIPVFCTDEEQRALPGQVGGEAEDGGVQVLVVACPDSVKVIILELLSQISSASLSHCNSPPGQARALGTDPASPALQELPGPKPVLGNSAS